MSTTDHYGQAAAELELADHALNRDGYMSSEERNTKAGQHLARGAIHALLALVDAIDDASTERNLRRDDHS